MYYYIRDSVPPPKKKSQTLFTISIASNSNILGDYASMRLNGNASVGEIQASSSDLYRTRLTAIPTISYF